MQDSSLCMRGSLAGKLETRRDAKIEAVGTDNCLTTISQQPIIRAALKWVVSGENKEVRG